MNGNSNNSNIFQSLNENLNSSILSQQLSFSQSLSPVSPANNSNISYYQSLPKVSTPLLNNYINNPNQSYINFQTNKSDYEEPKTPRMSITKMDDNSNNIPKINEQHTTGNLNIETKYTSSDLKDGIEDIPEIQNIVCTINLGCKLNLKEIALQAKNCEYRPKKFTGLIMKIKEPKTTALIFHTGKMVCLGAKTEEDSIKACRRFGKILKVLNYKIILTNYKIENMVGSCNVKFKIPLIQLSNYIVSKGGKSRVYFEPEIFPGLIYRYIGEKDQENSPNIVFLIFNSGKMVIAGAKERNQIYEAFRNFYPLLKLFKNHLDKNKK